MVRLMFYVSEEDPRAKVPFSPHCIQGIHCQGGYHHGSWPSSPGWGGFFRGLYCTAQLRSGYHVLCTSMRELFLQKYFSLYLKKFFFSCGIIGNDPLSFLDLYLFLFTNLCLSILLIFLITNFWLHLFFKYFWFKFHWFLLLYYLRMLTFN